MASYYPSFTYMGINSLKDKKLIVAAFDPDQGEVDTFLGMDCVYTDKYDGSRRLDYGAKFNSTAVIKISVVKSNYKEFTVAEVRDFLKWTTGIRHNSYLDLLIGDEAQFSFLGRVTNAYQQKVDARTVGLSIEFTSVSPWAYSPVQYAGYSPDQSILIDANGVAYKNKSETPFKIDNGTVYNDSTFNLDMDGTIYINNSSTIQINNKTDDLYTPVYLNTTFKNANSDMVSIKNITLNEDTVITGLSAEEVITLSENQFILSDKNEKVFGNNFNFVWPRLAPGINEFVIDANGSGSVEFSYRYPIKIGDCAIDINEFDNTYMECLDDYISSNNGTSTVSGNVSWNNVTNKPTTLGGYGITDAYTISEVNNKINDTSMNIDEVTLNGMLTDVLGQ